MCLLLHSSFCLFDTLLIACVTFCPYLRTVVDEGDVSTVVVDGAVVDGDVTTVVGDGDVVAVVDDLRTVVDEGDVSTVVVDGDVAAVVDDDDGGVAAVVVAAQSNVIYHFMVPFVSANRFSN